MQRIDALAQVTEEPGRLTRTFGSPAMRRANDLVASWMREAGMSVRKDAIGNLIGHYDCSTPNAKSEERVLVLGSHLDTVRDAGRFDGALGVLVAVECVKRLHEQRMRLPFAIKVVGFADEEGVRFQAAYLGSKSLAGTFARADLQRKDAVGVSLSEAIRSFGGDPKRVVARRRRPGQLVGYLEVHIEQGPILEQQKLALGVVTAIAGQSRATVAFKGSAGHAGTTPINLRHDALCAAAEFTLAVEALACRKKRLVATVGETTVLPGASNVIPGEVRLSLDVRHPNDAARQQSATELRRRARGIAAARHVKLHWQSVQETPAVQCDKRLTALLSEAVKRRQRRTVHLHSGAGHDAAVMAAITPVAMLFVRCKGGISHHPDESASAKDIEMALKVLEEFVRSYEPM